MHENLPLKPLKRGCESILCDRVIKSEVSYELRNLKCFSIYDKKESGSNRTLEATSGFSNAQLMNDGEVLVRLGFDIGC